MISRRPAPAWFRDVEERFSGLELLFDLIFVFCVSQLTRTFRDDPTWSTAVTAALLFVPVWWAWIGVTFATDRFPADDGNTRLLVVAAAAATTVMALSVPAVPGGGEVSFALGYAACRFLLALFYLRVRRAGPDGGRLARFYATGFASVGALWIVSLVLPSPLRLCVWAGAMLLDVTMPRLADRAGRLLGVDRSHLAERCGAFVIIVIGESVVETLDLASEQRPSAPLLLSVVGAAALSIALWWGFFDQGSWRRRYEALEGERSGQFAAVICSYLHFPLVLGIAAAAGGVQLAVEHADGVIGLPAALAVTAGCSGYLLAMNAMTRVLGVPRRQSLARHRWVIVAALAGLAAIGSTWPPAAYLACVVLLLSAHATAGVIRFAADRRRSPDPA